MNLNQPQIQGKLAGGYGTSDRATEQRQLPPGMAEVSQIKLTLDWTKPAI